MSKIPPYDDNSACESYFNWYFNKKTEEKQSQMVEDVSMLVHDYGLDFFTGSAILHLLKTHGSCRFKKSDEIKKAIYFLEEVVEKME